MASASSIQLLLAYVACASNINTMWLPFLALALSASLFFNLILVYQLRTAPSIIGRSARWTSTLFFMCLGCAALVILREGLAATGNKELRWLAVCTWAVYMAMPMIAMRHRSFTIITPIVVLYLLTFSDARQLLAAGLAKRGWIAENEDPFWWVHSVPGFGLLSTMRVRRSISLNRGSTPGFLSLRDMVKPSGSWLTA